MTKDEIILAHKNHLFPAVFHYFKDPLVLSHAKDQFVFDADGREYLDFFGGIVTVSLGHANPEITKKVHEQIDTLQHASPVFATEPQARLASRLAQITPGGALTKSYFTNSGTEANETAILTARCYTGRTEIVALRHSYHGRSAAMMTATGNAGWRLGGVPQPGVTFAHNAYCYRCPFGLSYPDCGVKCAEDVEEVIRTTTSGQIAAFIAEPIQGVGGFITPPKEYFPIVDKIIHKYGGVFISDEVQTAWGRTGTKWFGIEQWGVQPDMITSAKGLGNGTPLGVTISRPEIADGLKGATISTFGGNPVAMAAANAVLDYIETHDTRTNVEQVGAYLRGKLLQLQQKHAIIGDVRGMGLLQAIELVEDRETKKPASAATNQLLEAARDNRILIGKGGLYGNVIRLSPPMNISKADVDEFAIRLDRSLSASKTAATG